MILAGLARLGRDATLRRTPQGDPVLDLVLAFNHGPREEGGNRETQWIEASIWGKRAEKLAPHMTKGTAIDVVITDPHVETWTKKDQTTGFKLVGRVADFEFAGGGNRESGSGSSNSKPNPTERQQAGGFGDPSDDIPF